MPAPRWTALPLALAACAAGGCGSSSSPRYVDRLGGTAQMRAEGARAPLAGGVAVLSPAARAPAGLTGPSAAAFRYFGAPIGPFAGDDRLYGPPRALEPVTPAWSVRFLTPARRFDVLVVGGSRAAVRVSADGATDRIRHLPTAWGRYRLRVELPHPARRSIRVDLEGGELFGGVAAGGPVRRSPVRVGPRVIVVGDSFAAGEGADARFTGLVQDLGADLGLGDLWASAAGGTGYVTAAAAPPFGPRLRADVLRFHPQTVIFAGGVNDAFRSHAAPARVYRAALAAFTATRRALPYARIVVVGPWAASDQLYRYSNLGSVAGAIRRAAARASVRYIDPDGWITGTGDADHPTGHGNADRYIDATKHPTQAGHAYLADRLARAIESG